MIELTHGHRMGTFGHQETTLKSFCARLVYDFVALNVIGEQTTHLIRTRDIGFEQSPYLSCLSKGNLNCMVADSRIHGLAVWLLEDSTRVETDISKLIIHTVRSGVSTCVVESIAC